MKRKCNPSFCNNEARRVELIGGHMGNTSFNYEEQLAGFVKILTIKFGDPAERYLDFVDEHEVRASVIEKELPEPGIGGDCERRLPEKARSPIPRVRFDESVRSSQQSTVKISKCEDFMEQTISVSEIEKIFDIDFEKDWIKLVSSYQPPASSTTQRTKEQLLLYKKIQKAEKLLRKRDKEIRLLMQRAKTPSEAENVRRHVMEKMRAKAEKYMEKRRRQWQKDELKEKKKKEAYPATLAEVERGDH